MSILFLYNSAPNYHYFFSALAKKFVEDDFQVVLAVDSDYSRNLNRIHEVTNDIYIFSTFFENHKISGEVLARYKEYNLNYALLSDFERAEVYGIWNHRQYENEYFDRLKSALLSYFEHIFDAHGVECVIYENVSNTFAYFAYIVANAKGKKYLGLAASRLPGRFEITTGPFDFELIQRNFDKIQNQQLIVDDKTKGDVKEYIKRIEEIEPDYMAFNNLSEVGVIKRYARLSKIHRFLSLFQYGVKRSHYNFQIGNPLRTHLKLFIRNLARRIRCYRISRLYDGLDLENNYLLYPLHFHPESSTSILSGNNLDEYEVVRSIAFNLPVGVNLLIKDHKSAWGYPSIDFYKKIKRLPNVKLLPPEAPTKKLIKGSIGVITLTSTVGYEALIMGKPIILIGRVFYEFHRGVFKLQSKDKMFSVIKKCMSYVDDPNSDYNETFVQAYWISACEGSLNLTKGEPPDEDVLTNVYFQLKKFLGGI
jgi:hypothetical protein